MERKIEEYKNQHKKEQDKGINALSPFKILTQKYGNLYSKEKIVEIYLEEMKKDLCQNIGCSDSKSDKSMHSDDSTNQFAHLINMQDAQK